MPSCVFKQCKTHPKIIEKADGIYELVFNKTSSDRLSYFHFPQNEVLREKWTKVVAQERGEVFFKANESSVVCSDHFLESDKFLSDKGSQLIKATAIPCIELETKPHAVAGADSELVACRACLAVDGRLLPISGSGFEDTIAELTGVADSMEGFPRHLCAYCRARLSKCAAFRDSCRRSTALLRRLLERNPVNYLVTMDDIKAIDRNAHNLTNGLTREEVIHLNPIKKENNKTLDQLHENFADAVHLENNENININVDETEIHVNNEKVVSEDVVSIDSSEDDYVDAEKEINYSKDMEREEIDKTIENIEETFESQNKTVSDSLESRPEIYTKTNRPDTGNTVFRWGIKIKNIVNNGSRGLDIKAFEKDFNCEVRILSIEEQRQEIEKKIEKNKSRNLDYYCKTCGKEFKSEIAMKKHSLWHEPSEGTVECEICRRHFRGKTMKWWGKHRKLHRIKLTCKDCGHVSRDTYSAKTHSIVHTGKTFACRHCDQEYRHRTSYLHHVRWYHPTENVACEECGDTFPSHASVRRHKALVHGITKPKEEFVCSVCDVTFSSAEALGEHTRSGFGVSHAALFPCGACGESCGSDAARAAHMADKHPADQNYCSECDMTFSNAASFALHTRRKHLGMTRRSMCRPRGSRPQPEPRAVCEVCGRTVKNQRYLKIHMYSHMAQKPCACPACPKTFINASARKLHLRTHTGEKPFQCAHCLRAFGCKSSLAAHITRVHLKTSRRYPCDICLKTFATSCGVKLHVSTVHNNMPRSWNTHKKSFIPK